MITSFLGLEPYNRFYFTKAQTQSIKVSIKKVRNKNLTEAKLFYLTMPCFKKMKNIVVRNKINSLIKALNSILLYNKFFGPAV